MKANGDKPNVLVTTETLVRININESNVKNEK